MRKIAVLLYFITISAYAQQVIVTEEVQVTKTEEGRFYYPAMSPDGISILFTSEDYKGLWLKNPGDGGLIKINDDDGAGYEPQFNSAGNEIIYRTDKFESGKRFSSLKVQNIDTRQTVVLEKDVRDLYPPKSAIGSSNFYMKNGVLSSHSAQRSITKVQENFPVAYIENSQIVLFENGEKKFLSPLGEGNYIWPSVSPDGDKLLFTFAGKGAFISDLKGNIIAELDYANYPSWSRDGKWIVFMEDYDDGYQITASELGVVSSDGASRYYLTETSERIELYPKWSPTTDEIVFHTDGGEIYKLKLTIN